MLSATAYLQINLVSDQPTLGAIQDTKSLNAWGIAASPTGPFWVANNHSDTATVYGGNVNHTPLTKNPLEVVDPNGGITGVVFNGTGDFVIDDGNGNSGSALFLFASEDGTIDGWNPNVPPPAPSLVTQTAFTATDGAIYKGLAIGDVGGEHFIYAADFHNAKIDVIDTSFTSTTLAGSFTDPALPAGYAPFNVQNIGGTLFVTYALQDADAEDEVAGAHLGFVDKFDTSGHLLGRFASGDVLNAPWAIVQAPIGFGRFSGDILVGNFGDGRINAFDPTNGQFVGALSNELGKPIQIEGLWGLSFGNSAGAGDKNALYFTAGPDDETHGLFGKISAAKDISPKVLPIFGLTSVDFRNHHFAGRLRVQNLTNRDFLGPITIVFKDVPQGVTITNATGYTVDGKPYITLSKTLKRFRAIKFAVQFDAPTKLLASAIVHLRHVETLVGEFD